MLRDQDLGNGQRVDVWDLHADNGDAYFAKTRGGLPAQVAGKHTTDSEDAAGRRKAVAAAKSAVTGDLNEARKMMATAYLGKNPKIPWTTFDAPGAKPTIDAKLAEKIRILKKNGKSIGELSNYTDGWVWSNSIDALTAGAGSPTVRAGVLRLIGQMPEIQVKKDTVDGQPVLTLAAGSLATGNGTETLTINADTGLPIKFASHGLTITYTVTRVTLADVAKGKF